MPSSATITAFYNFSANTKARASQVNTNFDVFRGHIIPVHPSTATSADSSYDLGSTEYRWRNAYVQNIIFGNTTTSNLSIETTTTSTDMQIKIASSEVARFKSSGTMTFSSDVTTVSMTKGAANLVASTLTINSHGRPVEIGICPALVNSSFTSEILVTAATTTVQTTLNLEIYRNTVTSVLARYQYATDLTYKSINVPISNIKAFDSAPPNTTNSYFIYGIITAATTTGLGSGFYLRAYAKREL